MAVELKGRNFISIEDFTEEEIYQIIRTAEDLKLQDKRNQKQTLLSGKNLAMIFQKPSLRTRVSFQVGMRKLDGTAIYLGPDDVKLGKRETIEDIARALSRYVDIILARVFKHEHTLKLGKYSEVPVINGLSDFSHPTQIMADLLTVFEKKRKLKGIDIAFVGDGNNVANSLMFAAARVGFRLTLATPPKYAPKREMIEKLQQEAAECGGGIKVVEEPETAVRGADFIYTDVWTSMGQEEESERRKKDFRDYQVNSSLLEVAPEGIIILHCMPIHYGEEITYKVVKNQREMAIYDQAENRMYTAMALLTLFC